MPSLGVLRDLVRDIQEGEALPDLVEAALSEDAEAVAADAFDPRFIADVESDLRLLTELSVKLDRFAQWPDPKLESLAAILKRTTA